MKVFVGGGSGLAGSAILRAAPIDVELFHPTHSELPLENYPQVFDYFKENKISHVILAAGQVGGILANNFHQKDFLLENLKIQNSVFQAAVENDIKNFIFLGSSCIYPRLAIQPIKEEALLTGLLEPTNEGYALAKICGIKLCTAIHKEYGYNYVALMPSNLYGLNDNFDRSNSHVPAALMRKIHEAKLANAREVDIWGSGEVKREFMSSKDLANACWYFLNSEYGGELINIGTGVDISILEFASILKTIIGYQGKFKLDLSKPNGTPRKLLDVSKATSFGWQSSIDLKAGLSETYEWFVEQYGEGSIRGY